MTCPACGESAWGSRRELPSLTVLTCTGCGLLASQIDAAPVLSYADVVDADYDAGLANLRRQQTLEVLQFVQASKRGDPASPRSGVSWLDIGCGPGYLLKAAAHAGYRIRGVEPDEKAFALASARLGQGVVRRGLFNEAEESPVTIVSTLDVLEHVPVVELPAFVNAIRRSLAPHGIWIIKVPSAEGMYFRLAHALGMRAQVERCWQVGYVSPHRSYFTRMTLTRFLQRHGFEPIASRSMEELPLRTAVARLTMRGTMARWKAVLALPAIAAVNLIERLRGKSDTLLVIARPQ
jgi:2-polyprenyl-3-methyl-5-hydroxy-6-metoxy-1,4-benzoquinol methylase